MNLLKPRAIEASITEPDGTRWHVTGNGRALRIGRWWISLHWLHADYPIDQVDQ